MLKVNYAHLLRLMAYTYPFNGGKDTPVKKLLITDHNYDDCPYLFKRLGVSYSDWVKMGRLAYRYRRKYLHGWAKENGCCIVKYQRYPGVIWFRDHEGRYEIKALYHPSEETVKNYAV